MERIPTPTFREPRARRELALADALPALTGGDPRVRYIRALSDLSRADAADWARTWPAIPVETRAMLVRRMRALAEERVELDFGRALRIALDDPAAVVRTLAIDALWEERSDELAERLLEILHNDPDVDVRSAAAAALGRFAVAAEGGELDERLVPALRHELRAVAADKTNVKTLRLRALEAVAVFERDALVWQMIEDAYASDDADARPFAVRAMGHNLDPRWLRIVLDELRSGDRAVRVAAAEASGELGDEAAVPLLSDLAGHEDADVRAAAIRALGQIGGPMAVRALHDHMREAEGEEWRQLSEAMDEALGGVDPLLPS